MLAVGEKVMTEKYPEEYIEKWEVIPSHYQHESCIWRTGDEQPKPKATCKT